MPKAQHQAATVGGSADDVEAQFYDALRKGDISMLMNCWADEDDILCIHPAGPRMLGPGPVRSGFELLLAQGPLLVHAEQVHRVEALASAVHSVLERIEVLTPQGPMEAWVVANHTAQVEAAK